MSDQPEFNARSILERCLEKALAADPADAPFGLSAVEAGLWHRAQANAYQHALEMLGSA